MKPTERIAKLASTSRTGLFATLRGLVHAGGSGVPWRALLAIPLATLCALLALSAGIARAEPPKLVPYGSFSTNERNGVGVAVEGSGDLFVSGFFSFKNYAPSEVVKLDPSGKLLSPPSPFGSGYYSGVAVNPTNGDVYVLGEDTGGIFAPLTPTTIFVYDPSTGALLSSFEVPASLNFLGVFTDVQIAADSAGNVYVPVVSENKVLEYSPTGTLLKTFTGSGAGALKEPTGVALDSSGNLRVVDSGNNRIVELDSSGAPVEVNGKPVEIESEGGFSVALDGHGDVFAVVDNSADPCGERGSPCLHLVEYSSEGRQLADVGAGAFGLGQVGGGDDRIFSMVAVNQASGRVYVTDGNRDTVWVFGPPVAPVVDRELTAEVGASEAKLGALVNPGGIQTSYRFEYGTTTEYGSSTPFPEGSVGEGVQSRAVWASANGLALGTTYHYRVVATNELGPAYGPDQTFTTETAAQAACPNEQLRGGFSQRLPDCRAYELVTPPVTSGSQFDADLSMAYASKAAADGEALTLTTAEPRPGAPTAGEAYVARRGAGGWTTEDIMPFESYDGAGCTNYQRAYAFSTQVTRDVMLVGGGSRASASENGLEDPESCNPEGRQVVSGEPVGYENLLVRENATGTYQLVNVVPARVTPADAHFKAASADLSHVIFTETSPLAQGARYGVENLYEWDEGALRLLSVLPDGTAVPGSLPEEQVPIQHVQHTPVKGVVASDGSHVLFTYGGALYDRIGGRRTVQVDEKQGGSGPGGGGSFKAATPDGSKVFFLDESKLTAGSTAEAGEPDLYECALGEGASKCELTDLTVAAGGGHADVVRVMPLGRHDSSYIYFVAKGVLASNTRQFTNSEGKTVVEGAQAGEQNLYLWDGSKTTFIATGVEHSRFGIEQASPDGKWLAFESEKSLTGYNSALASGNECGGGGAACPELFLYSAATGQLACASCNPTGEPAIAGGGVARRAEALGEVYGVFPTRGVLTDAGQVFFETTEALVPSDTNGQRDVYEFQGAGAHLISSGTSSFETALESVSESGNDVFFRSTQALVPQDNQEGQFVTYDARVAGGFPVVASPPACTTADACRTPVSPQPSIYGAPASQTFSGVGNLTQPPPAKPVVKPKPKTLKCRNGFVKRKIKRKTVCVRNKARKASRSAHANRTGK
ncbi:MAG TPA: NHL repeat-containing protein [Solirubrobacteraceae bacterium]|jgi:DNA-binding beta-propeller fold protein YncE|nr:NHL repeat-containing protein [Solirubrobacteraceae bacterium]